MHVVELTIFVLGLVFDFPINCESLSDRKFNEELSVAFAKNAFVEFVVILVSLGFTGGNPEKMFNTSEENLSSLMYLYWFLQKQP